MCIWTSAWWTKPRRSYFLTQNFMDVSFRLHWNGMLSSILGKWLKSPLNSIFFQSTNILPWRTPVMVVAGVAAAAWGAAAAASWRPVFVSRRRSGRGVGRRTPTTVNCSLNPSLADPRLICTRISRTRYCLVSGTCSSRPRGHLHIAPLWFASCKLKNVFWSNRFPAIWIREGRRMGEDGIRPSRALGWLVLCSCTGQGVVIARRVEHMLCRRLKWIQPLVRLNPCFPFISLNTLQQNSIQLSRLFNLRKQHHVLLWVRYDVVRRLGWHLIRFYDILYVLYLCAFYVAYSWNGIVAIVIGLHNKCTDWRSLILDFS